MRSDNPLITEITVPSNAGPGQPRIVIAGNTITGYYADDIIAWQCTVDPTATILSNTDAFPILTALLRNGTFVSQYPNAIAHNFSTAVWQNTDSTGVFTVGNNDVTGNHGESDLARTVSTFAAWHPAFETKQSPTPGSGWSNAAGTLRNAPPVQYWYNSLDQLEVRGALSVSNAGILSSTAFVLDSNHTPVAGWNLQQDYIFQQSSAGAQKGPAHVFVSGSNVSINNLSAVANGDIVNFNHTFAMGYNP